ncbi:LANO_0H15896g1_1 [Lachancea nothofagi CBS 11611]|uniref:LANO_0H15896g1_1 n=1 Tax=Lachancea nothofagi CBS 11611 TaxID=1266666 RepID=A0A1G4KN08_9SACH|nr:LANO_0H15896g1_1 [Lachancea nothofagi CBS 11611]
MIRTPTRTKTKSFAGSQIDFQFPSSESVPEEALDNYDMSNHHLLNNTLAARDNVSHIFSENSAGSSNGIDSGMYSFANISDNTTGRKAGHNGLRPSQTSSWGSSASVARHRYPATLAPRPHSSAFETLLDTQHAVKSRENAAFLSRKRSPEMSGHHSISTDACTIPTADNVSFQITFKSTPSEQSLLSFEKRAQLKRSKSAVRQPSLKLRKSPSLRKTTASTGSNSKLKRSEAVRCKGGLLQFFSQLGDRAKARVRRWRQAVRKKLFTYKSRRLAKKNKKQTTSHLKRANGYVSNIKRTISSTSLRKASINDPRHVSGYNDLNRVQTPVQDAQKMAQGSPKNIRKSLRRSPSSIKRAASILTRTNSLATTNFDGTNGGNSTEGLPRTKLVRSDPLMSLSSIARQPSIVVNNKVIPLSRLNGEINEYSIKEEEEDEYVIDTDYMRKSDDNFSDVSSADENEYRDSLEYPKDDRNSAVGNEAAAVPDAWNHFLRAVVAQRILMRLQIHKYQEAGTESECQKLIDAIISDYEENSSSHYESEQRTNSTAITSVSGSEHYITSRQTSDMCSKTNDSVLSLKPFQTVFQTKVKRSLTLPVGFRV